ncbi:NYN domain-containing protein [uncultured Mitsuokella sp.]|uniref:NYN domain-containing protein n=1 Tax=uncultured Mitsuokella sp. TaxID=453120 RepID=UPI0026DD14AD|nr:NYN domain-containing protein [uncultured Mitsuokella sp.]
MTLVSNNTTVGILYDIENAPFEMLNYTLGKARRFQPCRTIVISDWDARPEQKRWDKLLRRPGFTFRQISRTFLGKNSLDSALYDSAKLLYEEGVRRYFVITTDSDFVRIAEMLNSREKSYIIGVGTKQASETLRSAYDEFIVYPPEEKPKAAKAGKKAAKAQNQPEEKPEAEKKRGKRKKEQKDSQEVLNESKDRKEAKEPKNVKDAKEAKDAKSAKDAKETKAAKAVKSGKNAKHAKADKADLRVKPGKAQKTESLEQAEQSARTEAVEAAKKPQPAEMQPSEPQGKKARKKAAKEQPAVPQETAGLLTVRLPKTLRQSLEERMQHEEVTMDELITYLLMRGLSK